MTTAVDVARQALVYWGEWRGYPVDQWCQAFAGYYWPWAYQGNENNISVYPSAKAAWYATPGPADGTDMNPPPGAFVWWEIGEFWHVGNSAGNGYFVNTSTQGDTVEALDWGAKVSHISSYPGKYLGWTYRNGLNGPYPGLTAYSGGGGGGVDYAYGLTTEAQLATQQALTQLGFYDGDIDGVFGYWSVLAFQEYLGRGGLGLLPGDYTYDGIPGYYYGIAVQTLAAQHGYTGPIDGVPGEMTSVGIVNWVNSIATNTPTPTPPAGSVLDPTEPWKNQTPDSDLATWVGSPNYNYREPGDKRHVTLHWMVGTLAGTDAHFQNPGTIIDGRGTGTSSTYGVGPNAIHQYVLEADYHHGDGDAYSNAHGISIEHEGGWMREDGTRAPVAQETLDNSVDLLVDIAKRHGWSEYVWLENIFPHSHWVATECPGTLDVAHLINEANKRLKPVEPEPEPTPEPEEPDVPTPTPTPTPTPLPDISDTAATNTENLHSSGETKAPDAPLAGLMSKFPRVRFWGYVAFATTLLVLSLVPDALMAGVIPADMTEGFTRWTFFLTSAMTKVGAAFGFVAASNTTRTPHVGNAVTTTPGA